MPRCAAAIAIGPPRAMPAAAGPPPRLAAKGIRGCTPLGAGRAPAAGAPPATNFIYACVDSATGTPLYGVFIDKLYRQVFIDKLGNAVYAPRPGWWFTPPGVRKLVLSLKYCTLRLCTL